MNLFGKYILRIQPVVMALSLLLGVIAFTLFREEPQTAADSGGDAITRANHSETGAIDTKQDDLGSLSFQREAQANQHFRDWLGKYAADPGESHAREEHVRNGLLLAKKRKPYIEKLIQMNPRQALAEALRFDEWAQLPDEIKAEVEKPFSVTGAYTYYPICREPGTSPQPGEARFYASLTMPDGSSLRAFPHGRRDGVFSKRELPVQGIALSGMAAMRDGPLQILSADELAEAKESFSSGQADMGRSLVTSAPLGEETAYAVAGGKIYAFSNQKEAEELDAKLAELDQRPGPFAASSLLANSAYIGSDGSIDLPKIEATAISQASDWTETKKRLFLIRVNFPDRPEEPVALSSVENVMAQSSEMIRRMSYGKTWIESQASQNVYTLPKTIAYYQSIQWQEFESDARDVFRQNKSGADAGVDIGPMGNWNVGDLGDYDIVGTYRVTAAGEVAGGNAGGQVFTIVGAWANSIRVFTHEWLHNYGLGHSNLWKTTDGSIAGDGISEEYGDPFDLMGHARMPEGHVHSEAKVRLNWLPSAQWTDADISGSKTYRISRIDDTATPQKVHGVRVSRGGNGPANGYYWIGYRRAFIDNPRLQNGAYLVWQKIGHPSTWLLDATPGSNAEARDSTFSLGSTFADPLSHAFITPIATGGSDADSYLDVRVNLGPFPSNKPPQATEISGPLTVRARTPATFSVTGSDAEGDPLAYSWEIAQSTFSVTPNSPVLEATWNTGGIYPLKVTVSDMKGGTVQKSINVQVVDPLDQSATANIGRAVNIMDAKSGNGVIVGLGYWGELFHSWDGVAWSEIKHNTGLLHWTRMAFGNGVFVMSGHRDGETATRIAYSVDGRIWTMAQVPDNAPILREIAFGGGKFIAIGDGGTILSSADGLKWTYSQVGGAPDFRYLAWNGNAWLATAVNPENHWWETSVDPSNDWWDAVWSSADGVNWQEKPPIGVAGERIFGHNGAFYFLTWHGGIKRSTDNGLTWQQAALPGETPTWSWSVRNMTVANDGTMAAIAIEHLPTGDQTVPLVSVDGISWHRGISEGLKAAVNGANNLYFGAGRLLSFYPDGIVKYSQPIAVDNAAPTISSSSITSSAEARGVITLSAQANDPEGKSLRYFWDFGPKHQVVEGAEVEVVLPFGGSFEVVLRVIDPDGGLTSSTHTLDLRDPAQTFTTRESGALYGLAAIASNQSIAVAVGDANHPVLTSTDGMTWTKQSLPEWTYVHDIVWDGGKFIISGHAWRNGVWNNVIYTSADGITWTLRYTANAGTTYLRTIASLAGYGAVAAGDEGHSLYSKDGFTWSLLDIPALGDLGVTDIAGGASGYVMTALTYSPETRNKVLTSRDGINWQDQSAGMGLDAAWKNLQRVSWLHDRHIASGWYAGICSSTDGGAIFSQAISGGNIELRAMTYGNGIYFGTGWDRDNSGTDIDVFSLNGSTWFSSIPDTTNDRLGAVFFKNTFITVGEAGEIRQSDAFSMPVQDPNEVATLRSLEVSAGVLSPVFSPGSTSYTLEVGNSVASTRVTPTVTNTGSRVTVNGMSTISGSASAAIPLAVGSNTITVEVTAKDGITKRTYRVIVTRALSRVASLNSLSLSAGSLSPAFASGTTSYTLSVANGVASTTVTPTVTAAGTVKINGMPAASGVGSTSIPLALGASTITVEVTAQDGITKRVYTVAITRALSKVATLRDLRLPSGSLAPSFAADTMSYTLSVANTVSATAVTPTVTDSGARVRVNGVAVVSGALSQFIPLTVGRNTITVVVTAQDGVTKRTYTVRITRAPSDVATLRALRLSAGAITPSFSSGITSYTLSVANSISDIRVTPTVANEGARIKVNGKEVASGSTSKSIPLSVGRNTIAVEVTAQDGSTQRTYTVTVVRDQSSNAKLKALALDGMELSTKFEPHRLNYNAWMQSGRKAIRVKAASQHSKARIKINGMKVKTGTWSKPIKVRSEDKTLIRVQVIALNGSKKTYRVNVHRINK